MTFIDQIAPLVQKYAKQYGIEVCSPIIAQAILESASGTSELAVNANNYFGMKYRANRCPTSCGIYVKTGSEQNPDGSYTSSTMKWMKFANMEAGIQGYFDFINISAYSNLKGIQDPQTYLENIKADGYATSLNYVKNLMAVINKYNLTQYDRKESNMKINIHAGHNPDGMKACGAIGIIKESTEARLVKNLVVAKLQALGHTVHDCTCDNGKSASDVLQKIVKACNADTVDLDVSIHFNAGSSDKKGDGKTTGTEVLVYSKNSKAYSYASNTAKAISDLGFKNRGVKIRTDLYFLKHTNSSAMLIECCFVDDADDIKIYNAETMANAIVKGITGHDATNVSTTTEKPATGADMNPQGHLVRITVDSLNVRAGAGTSYPVKTTVLKGQVYTITEEQNGWGKLKSGAGWISLKYTEKC